MSKAFLLAEHATFMLPTNLCIKYSHISKEEYAVWSIDEIPVGTRFGPYEVKVTETKKNESESLYWQMSRLVEEDWDERASNWLWLVNYTYSKEQQNVIAIRHMSTVYYITSKCIPANTELLVFCAKEDAKKASLRKGNVTFSIDKRLGTTGFGQWSATMENGSGKERHSSCRQMAEQEFQRTEDHSKRERDHFDPFEKELSNTDDSISKDKEQLCSHLAYDPLIPMPVQKQKKEQLSSVEKAQKVNTWHLCDKCGKTFSRKGNLKRHQLVHTNEKPFKCTECDKTFKAKQELKDHGKFHSKGRNSKCGICGKAFKDSSKYSEECYSKHYMHGTTNEDLSKGKRGNLDPTDKQLFDVRGCSDIPSHKEQSNLRRDQIDGTWYICDTCGRSFSQKICLMRHNVVHSDEKPFKCNECGKRFKIARDLRDHERVHSEERKFKCDLCDKAFKHGSSLRAHKAAHSEERPHKCKYCGRAFKIKANLKRHKTFYCEMRPFLCQECG